MFFYFFIAGFVVVILANLLWSFISCVISSYYDGFPQETFSQRFCGWFWRLLK